MTDYKFVTCYEKGCEETSGLKPYMTGIEFLCDRHAPQEGEEHDCECLEGNPYSLIPCKCPCHAPKAKSTKVIKGVSCQMTVSVPQAELPMDDLLTQITRKAAESLARSQEALALTFLQENGASVKDIELVQQHLPDGMRFFYRVRPKEDDILSKMEYQEVIALAKQQGVEEERERIRRVLGDGLADFADGKTLAR
jgi:hypothetical protein